MATVFVSHSWKRGSDIHDRLVERLKKVILSEVRNTSISDHKAYPSLVASVEPLMRSIIKGHIKRADLFILVAHPAPSKWVQYEVECAVDLDKPRFAIRPKDYENRARLVTQYRMECVDEDWRSIPDAIRRTLAN